MQREWLGTALNAWVLQSNSTLREPRLEDPGQSLNLSAP